MQALKWWRPRHTRAMVAGVFTWAMGGVIGHVGATQWFARALGYSERYLGPPWRVDEAAGVKIYMPHQIWAWDVAYAGGRVDEVLGESFGILGAGVVVGLVFGAMVCAKFCKEPKHHTEHGSSRWATREEVVSRGLLATDVERVGALRKKGKPIAEAASLMIGKTVDGRYLYNWGKEHLFFFAPTRSGKGIGFVIPALLTWTESVLCLDIKRENFKITAWWRGLFSHVIYLDPTSMASARWNPLLELRRGLKSVPDAQNLAEVLYPSEGGGGNVVFWEKGAKDLLAAVVLYVLYKKPKKTLHTCSRLVSDHQATLELFKIVEIPENEHVQSYIRDVAKAHLGASENVRGGWGSGAEIALSLWKDPVVAYMTSASDFTLAQIKCSARPVSVYLAIPPNNLKRLSPFVRLFVEFLTDALTEDLDESDDQHRLLMLLDEFPQLGKMTKVEGAMAYTAGYGIKYALITQGKDQTDARYGRDNQLLSNCHVRCAYRCNDPTNAEYLAKLLGTTTAVKEQEGESGRKGLLSALSNRSVSEVKFARDLMTAGELQQLDEERLVVLESGQQPILAHRIKYYEEDHFKPRFEGRELRLPQDPLDDFPQAVVTSPWDDLIGEVEPRPSDDHVAAYRAELELEGMGVEEEESSEGGSPEACFDFGAKIEPQDAGEVAETIPKDLAPDVAMLQATTGSMNKADILKVFERAHRRGMISKEQLDGIMGTSRTPKEGVEHADPVDVDVDALVDAQGPPLDLFEEPEALGVGPIQEDFEDPFSLDFEVEQVAPAESEDATHLHSTSRIQELIKADRLRRGDSEEGT